LLATLLQSFLSDPKRFLGAKARDGGPIKPSQYKQQAQNRYGRLAGWIIGMMGDHEAADRSGQRFIER